MGRGPGSAGRSRAPPASRRRPASRTTTRCPGPGTRRAPPTPPVRRRGRSRLDRHDGARHEAGAPASRWPTDAGDRGWRHLRRAGDGARCPPGGDQLLEPAADTAGRHVAHRVGVPAEPGGRPPRLRRLVEAGPARPTSTPEAPRGRCAVLASVEGSRHRLTRVAVRAALRPGPRRVPRRATSAGPRPHQIGHYSPCRRTEGRRIHPSGMMFGPIGVLTIVHQYGASLGGTWPNARPTRGAVRSRHQARTSRRRRIVWLTSLVRSWWSSSCLPC